MTIWTLITSLGDGSGSVTNGHPNAVVYGGTFSFVGTLLGENVYATCSLFKPQIDSAGNDWVEGDPGIVAPSYVPSANPVPTCMALEPCCGEYYTLPEIIIPAIGASIIYYTETTRINLYDNLIVNSLLVPEAWYLITDYQTEAPIVGATPIEIFSAAVEQIFVQASSTNTIYPRAISKNNPNEVLLFKQDIPNDIGEIRNNFDSGIDNGPQSIITSTSDSVTITTNGHLMPTNEVDWLTSNLYFEGYDSINNNYFAINRIGNYKFQAAIDFDGAINLTNNVGYFTNRVTNQTTTTIQIDLVDLHFSDYNNDSSLYIEIYDNVNSIGYLMTESELGVNWTISNDGLITYIGSDSINLVGSTIYGTWNTSAYSCSTTAAGKITLLHMDLSTINISNIIGGVGYFDLAYSYINKIFYGRIVQRHNLALNTLVDEDYRGILHRRWKILASTWSAGTYNPGDLVNYSNTIYMCVDATSSEPSSVYSAWANLGNAALYQCAEYSPTIKSYPIIKDVASYVDRLMFTFPDPPTNFECRGTNPFTHQMDVSIINGNITNNKIYTLNGSITILEDFYNCDIKTTDYLIIKSMTYSIANNINGYVYYMNRCTFDNLSMSYVKNITYQNWDNINQSIFLSTVFDNTITKIDNCIFFGSVNGNQFKYFIYSTCRKDLINNIFIYASTNTINSSFDGNRCFGTFSNNVINSSFCSNNTIFAVYSFNTISGSFHSYNAFYKEFSSNTITSNFQNNKFFDSSNSNNISHASSVILNNTFNKSFTANVLSGAVNISGNIFGTCSSNSGGDAVTIQQNLFLYSFNSNTFNVGTNSSMLSSNSSLFEVNYNNFTNSKLQENKLLGSFSYNTFNKTSGTLMNISYNIFKGSSTGCVYNGDYFLRNEMRTFTNITFASSTSINDNIFTNGIDGATISSNIIYNMTTVADSTSITPQSFIGDNIQQTNTQVAGNLTINSPSGSHVNGLSFILSIKSTNVQTFVWNAVYKGSVTTPLPVSSSGGGLLDKFEFKYDTQNGKWNLINLQKGY